MLSDRDKLILTHLSAGKRDKEIARELGIADVTVRTEIRLICARLDVKNRYAALAKWAEKKGEG
jgi:two-component system, NarL family, nitrate/nitrite response regulator NarL